MLVVRSCHVLCFVRYAVSWRPLTSLSCTVCIILCPRCVGLHESHFLLCVLLPRPFPVPPVLSFPPLVSQLVCMRW